MAKPQLMGLETEYAFNPRSQTGGPGDRESALGDLLRHAHGLTSLPDIGAPGVFLANGARLYLDAGHHPEYATPECDSPRELVRFALAGDRVLFGLAQVLEKETSDRTVEIYRCNVDYASLQTWGCHESYQYEAARAPMRRQLVPHLVSRIVFTGAGGFDHRSPGIEFVLSPRVGHLVCESSGCSTENRGIFHTKDESLASAGYHRMHVLCGESLCSQWSNYLKVGTTALVVRMIEEGALDVESVAPANPVVAMSAFSADAALEVRVGVRRGNRQVRALDIQRHYLEAAEARLAEPWMPDWAGDVCLYWRAALEHLDEGAEIVSQRFDWAIKRQLLLAHADRRGFPASRRARATGTLRPVAATLAQQGLALDADQRLGLAPLAAAQRAVADPLLQRGDTTWEALAEALALRAELCEIDTRFGQLGAAGIFEALDHSGVLDHALPGLGSVEDATRLPPERGRAALRGRLVREYAGSGERYVADWTAIYDREGGRSIALGDPFGESAEWADDEEACLSRAARLRRRAREQLLRRSQEDLPF